MIEVRFDHIKPARIYERTPGLIPEAPGLYKWYLSEEYAKDLLYSKEDDVDYFNVFKKNTKHLDCVTYSDRNVGSMRYYGIYVGITEKSLRARINDHIKGNSSTLRQDLAFLIKGSQNKIKESAWILDYLLVGYIEDDTYDDNPDDEFCFLGGLETIAINDYITPLNRDKNYNGDICSLLDCFLDELPILD